MANKRVRTSPRYLSFVASSGGQSYTVTGDGVIVDETLVAAIVAVGDSIGVATVVTDSPLPVTTPDSPLTPEQLATVAATLSATVVRRSASRPPEEFDGDLDAMPDVTAELLAALITGSRLTLDPGDYKCTARINIDGIHGIHIKGAGTKQLRAEVPVVRIIFTGSGSAPFISNRNARNFYMEGVSLIYSNPAFTGYLLDRSSDGDPTPSYSTVLLDNNFGSTGGATLSAKGGVYLGDHVEADIQRNNFYWMQHAIVGYEGRANFSTVVKIEGNRFEYLTGASILNPHQAWKLRGNVYEPTTDEQAKGIASEPGFPCQSLDVADEFYDAQDGGVWVDVHGMGIHLHHSYFEVSPNTTVLRVDTTAGDVESVSVTDCTMRGGLVDTAVLEVAGPGKILDYDEHGLAFENGMVSRSRNLPNVQWLTLPQAMLAPAMRAVTSDYTMTGAESVLIVDATTAPIKNVETGERRIDVTLPSVADPRIPKGTMLVIKKRDTTANLVNINPAGGERVDGSFGVSIKVGGRAFILVSDGITGANGGWRLLAGERRVKRSGVASVANGGSIAHGLGVVPTSVDVASTNAAHNVVVIGVSSTNIDVAMQIVNPVGGGEGGIVSTPEDVRWWAETNESGT